jgi:hypothetical protein
MNSVSKEIKWSFFFAHERGFLFVFFVLFEIFTDRSEILQVAIDDFKLKHSVFETFLVLIESSGHSDHLTRLNKEVMALVLQMRLLLAFAKTRDILLAIVTGCFEGVNCHY